MWSDVALQNSSTPGRLTFVWGPDGDLVFDGKAAYAVLSRVLCHKTRHRSDRSYGTRLYTVVRDKRTTGADLSAAVTDAAQQLQQDGIAHGLIGLPRKLGSGRWRLSLRWQSGGRPQSQDVTL